ncbi:hypothetical protein FACS189485_03010 [Spirochaetia bacterium]|nr:hypothetical protein FACS189485_03010 [Spirochaetia bacterium]
MKKVAIFVEGQTEQIFVLKLLSQIFTIGKYYTDIQSLTGKTGFRRIQAVKDNEAYFSNKNKEWDYYFRVIDCHGGNEESTVKSDILEQLPRLTAEYFCSIIGIRDIYPLTDAVRLQRNMVVTDCPIPVSIILAVNEVEAWFLAEDNHYAHLSPELTIEKVNKIAGIDVRYETTEAIPWPSDILRQIYRLIGINYTKKAWQAQVTSDALDYENLYLSVRNRNNSLNNLLECIDGVFEESKYE